MNGAFTDQVLADKLAKLNSSQQSIETLSHWCIFHRKRAGQVVLTWVREFQATSTQRRVTLLYLANDILQNSRRKGPEFVNEFWKTMPDALQEVMRSGDDSSRNAVHRLLKIWEERKVFGAKDKDLRETFLGLLPSSAAPTAGAASPGATPAANRNGGGVSTKPGADAPAVPVALGPTLSGPLERIATAHAAVQESGAAEEAAIRKCAEATADLKNLERTAAGATSAETAAKLAEDLQEGRNALAPCLQQLEVFERKRSTLVSLLREALQTQESKMDRVKKQAQVASAQLASVDSLCRSLNAGPSKPSSLPGVAINAQPTAQQSAPRPPAIDPRSATLPVAAPGPAPAPPQTAKPVTEAGPNLEEANAKNQAADVAARLAASSSSAAMLSSVLSSLAAGDGMFTLANLSGGGGMDFRSLEGPPSEKRQRLEAGHTSADPGASTAAPAFPAAPVPSGEGNLRAENLGAVPPGVPSFQIPPLPPPGSQAGHGTNIHHRPPLPPASYPSPQPRPPGRPEFYSQPPESPTHARDGIYYPV